MSMRRTADQPTTVDLHLHTRFSDGDETPERVAGRCVEAGLRVVSCTDHDTMEGAREFQSVAERSGITVISGCEVTVSWNGSEMHCLAYFVDLDDQVFRARIAEVHNAELDWWRTWFKQAAEIASDVDWSAAQQRHGRGRIAYRGDYLDMFLTASRSDPRFRDYPLGRHEKFIRDWCTPGRPLHVPRPWRPDLAQVVEWVAEAGGVTILAHPARALAAGNVSQALVGLRELGVAGIEAWTTWHDPSESSWLAELASAHGLVATQGSDYHGVRLKPWAPRPGLVPLAAPDPLAIVEGLEAARPPALTPEKRL
jgi:hypothetical protein